MSNPEEFAAPRDVTESDPNAGGPEGLVGGMGVSSERVGKVRGSDAETTHGAEETHPETHPDPPGDST